MALLVDEVNEEIAPHRDEGVVRVRDAVVNDEKLRQVVDVRRGGLLERHDYAWEIEVAEGMRRDGDAVDFEIGRRQPEGAGGVVARYSESVRKVASLGNAEGIRNFIVAAFSLAILHG